MTKEKILNPIIALVFPFIVYLYGMWNKRLDVLRYALPMFYGLLGYTFQLRSQSDAYRAVEQFKMINETPGFSFIDYLTFKLLNYKTLGTEVYYDFLSSIVGVFTDEWRFFFMLNGIIAGVIAYGIIRLVLKNQPNTHSLILFLISIISLPINMLNGRFWLASMLFILICLCYITTNQKKYVFLSFIVVFIHQGLFFASILLLLFSFLGKRRVLVMVIYLFSMVYAGTGAQIIPNALNLFEGKVAEQIEGYQRINEKEKELRLQKTRSQNFLLYSYRSDIILLLTTLGVFYILFFQSGMGRNNMISLLALLAVLFLSFHNFTSSIASLGGRYLRIGAMIGFIPILLSLNGFRNIVKIPMIVAFSFVFLVDFRLDAEQLNVFFPVWGYLYGIVYIPDVTVMEFIK